MKRRIEFTTEETIRGRKEIAKINEYVNGLNYVNKQISIELNVY